MSCCCADVPGPAEHFGGVEELLPDADFALTAPAAWPLVPSAGSEFEVPLEGPHGIMAPRQGYERRSCAPGRHDESRVHHCPLACDGLLSSLR